MAGPVRFRRSNQQWDEARVRRSLFAPLDERFGARMRGTHVDPPDGYTARRVEMDNGDLALFAWHTGGDGAYWLGNTETPETLWRTDKETFEQAPSGVGRWAQQELLVDLERQAPWLAAFDHVAWFFLPVLFSKDGRETTRAFFDRDAAGFPDAAREQGLGFYERFLETGVLDDHRYTMAAKLGTSERTEFGRMRATMGEFDAAKLLTDAGHEFVPEAERDSGHALDFAVSAAAGERLVEVTRPRPPRNRPAGTPVAALTRTVESKTQDQLAVHSDAILLVDCTSFRDDEWNAVRGERPELPYEPTAVFRYRPDGSGQGYQYGDLPIDLDDAIEWL